MRDVADGFFARDDERRDAFSPSVQRCALLGRVVVELALNLQRLGWLAPCDARDPDAIAAAILALGSAALTKNLRQAE
jgi:hypothetical protein